MNCRMSFDYKYEWVDTGEGFLAYPLGSALLACISGDKPESHLLLRDAMPDKKSAALLREWVDAVLVTQDERTALMRLRDLCEARPRPGKNAVLKAERRFYEGEAGLESRLFLCCDDCAALLFASLEQMAEAGLTVRRCEYCGGYFVPFSSRTLYCDRMVGDTGKSCKELAAREKYENKIADNEGRTLFNRRCKAYAMRVRRDPVRFNEEEYRAWKDYAELSLKAYSQGKLSMELLQMVLELPEK